jgi:hypothetical protein
MQHRVRLGPFEYNPRTRKLRKDGIKPWLQTPRQALTSLLAHSGELIGRNRWRNGSGRITRVFSETLPDAHTTAKDAWMKHFAASA